ncbi:tRNA guanosine-2'-O-methyltransferase, putative [Plasmodium ovale wallikeri]|uniref:tRNA guanosine-2'-O-methyltransferase, putative n=1 Tax=Plasmodium ovale wallikeri TaxID=864142 RepID=A0A1A8Z8R6_PLAOA|nr:tRNA guanosine-2'-O-methyltransferase, putative [Plasmodium ovale wallikeri]SBT40690.1 tRNA guanosine-2'-O-methyltransferase, putative [Plasmodium ovale wallikeri]
MFQVAYEISISSHKKYDECKLTELVSLLDAYGYKDVDYLHKLLLEENKKKYSGKAFVKINVSEEEEIWQHVTSRSILVKGVIQIWSEGSSYDEVLKNLMTKKYLFEETLDNKKWCFYFNAFGKVINQEEKIKKMNFFKSLLDKYNSVDLLNPDVQLGLLEEYDQTDKGTLKTVYFGKCVALRKYNKSLIFGGNTGDVGMDTEVDAIEDVGGNEGGNATSTVSCAAEWRRRAENPKVAWWTHYALNRRPILGPTTTDNELAFIMCNIAKIKSGHIVLDPFVGSGGLLITASIFNAICIGNDIDIRLLKGYKLSYLNPHMKHKNNKKSIFENFVYYNLNMPEILVSDNSRPVWNFFHRPWVDAIVTDPPYGHRATVRMCVKSPKRVPGKSIKGGSGDNSAAGSRGESDVQTGEEGEDCGEIVEASNDCDEDESKKVKCLMNTKTVAYSCSSAVKDLLNIASHVLVDNGMLVFLLPIQTETLEEDIALLNHEDFTLISYDFQSFTPTTGRFIVSMKRKCRQSASSN